MGQRKWGFDRHPAWLCTFNGFLLRSFNIRLKILIPIPISLTNSRLLHLHQRTILGKPRNYPFQVLAFDHRTQFEDSCKQHNQPTSRITEFKSLVFEGFKKVAADSARSSLALLVDPQYGADILQDSAYTHPTQ